MEVIEKITDCSRAIFSYCLRRTNTQEEAEDLSQDILLELLKCIGNLRDMNAFYGFMWGVAGNVYKNWLKGRKPTVELDNKLQSNDMPLEDTLIKNEEIMHLRRMLSLLSSKYRLATVKYYVEGKSCSEIAEELDTSLEMVKYLLFKARRLMKEGYNMSVEIGTQSYDLKSMYIAYSGSGDNIYYKLAERKIPQNILMACFYEGCSEQEISLQLGIPLGYLEDEIKLLFDNKLLRKKGDKYFTNFIIFTNEFQNEADQYALKLHDEIADIVYNELIEAESEIRQIDFYGNDMDRNAYLWHCMSMVFFDAVVANKRYYKMPKNCVSGNASVWGVEVCKKADFYCNYSCVGNEKEDRIYFRDCSILDRVDHHYLYGERNKHKTNLLIDIIMGKNINRLGVYEQEILADLIEKGFLKDTDGRLNATFPVYTKDQMAKAYLYVNKIADIVRSKLEEHLPVITRLLDNHTPTHLKEQVDRFAWMQFHTYGMEKPMWASLQKGYIKKPLCKNAMLGVYMVLD